MHSGLVPDHRLVGRLSHTVAKTLQDRQADFLMQVPERTVIYRNSPESDNRGIDKSFEALLWRDSP